MSLLSSDEAISITVSNTAPKRLNVIFQMYYFVAFYVLFYKCTVLSVQEKIALTLTKILFLPDFDLRKTLLHSSIH